MSENTEINTRPLLILHLDFNRENASVSISIENIGNFLAYNVKFDESELTPEEGKIQDSKFVRESTEYPWELQKVGVVPPEGKVEVMFESYRLDSELYRRL
jgi:hypothetical protein